MLENMTDFGARLGVTRQCVAGYIRRRKLTGAAIIKRNGAVLVDVDMAMKQLDRRLDGDQRAANGKAKLHRGPTAEPASEPSAAPPADDVLPASIGRPTPTGNEANRDEGDDDLDAELKREKLVALQRANRQAAAEEALAQGRYTLTEDCRRQIVRVAARAVRVYEGAIPEIATAIAGRFALDVREVTIAVNDAFRNVRAAESKRALAEAERLPKFVADPDAD